MSAASSARREPAPLVDEQGGDLRRPEVFFTKTWRGSGVATDAFGIPQDRYEVSFGPIPQADGSVVVDHRIMFESGLVNGYEWALLPTTGDAIAARDLKTGVTAKGSVNPVGFQWGFDGRYKTPFGVQRCRHDVVITLLSPIEIESAVTVSFLGVTVGAAASHLRLQSGG